LPAEVPVGEVLEPGAAQVLLQAPAGGGVADHQDPLAALAQRQVGQEPPHPGGGPIDYAAFARACGGKGYRIEDPSICGEILDAALQEPGPVIIDAIVDPFEPPMPPKVSLKQAAKLAEALAKGTPNRMKTALTIGSDTVREVI